MAFESDGKIELIDINSKEGMKIYRRTLTYIMGKAFWHIYLLFVLFVILIFSLPFFYFPFSICTNLPYFTI